MERILWLDGHISSISEEEAQVNSYAVPTEDSDVVFVLLYNDFEFEWHNNMWMQV